METIAMMNPPPPAMASIKDAMKHAADKKRNVCRLNSAKKVSNIKIHLPFKNLTFIFL